MSKANNKKLLVLDVEGTVFETSIRLPSTNLDSTIWQALAKSLGPEAVSAEIETHQRWQRGEYSGYLEWMKDTIRIHKNFGLSKTTFKQIIAGAIYNPGVKAMFSELNRDKFEIVLISGGFRELARRAQQDFQIHHAFAACEYFFGDNDLLAAFNLLPCDFEGKLDFVRLMLREYQLGDQDWIFIGDGANDVPIAKAAPVSIAYHGHAKLREIASYCFEDFSKISDVIKQLSNVSVWLTPHRQGGRAAINWAACQTTFLCAACQAVGVSSATRLIGQSPSLGRTSRR